MKTRLRPLALVVMFVLLVGGLWGTRSAEAAAVFKSPLPPAQSFTSSTKVPTDLDVYVPCAMQGAGEEVHLSGNMHLLYHFTATPTGGYDVKSQVQLQGVSGYGLSSGVKYQATGGSQGQFHIKGLAFSQSFVDSFKIIGQGPGNNLSVHENLHVTVNAQGQLTAFADHFSITCK